MEVKGNNSSWTNALCADYLHLQVDLTENAVLEGGKCDCSEQRSAAGCISDNVTAVNGT